MKCVKNNEGKVTRLTNELAEALVSSGNAVYTNKTEWKKGGRK